MKNSAIITLVISLILMNQLNTMEPQKPAVPGPGYYKPLPPVPPKKPATSVPQTNTQPVVTSSGQNTQEVKLTYAQEKNVQTIIKDINKVMENSVTIAKNGVKLGKTASLENIFNNAKETATIVAKLGISSALIADIYLNIEKLSEATPEQKSLARKRILPVLDSAEFKASQTELIKLAADDSLPQVIRIPLQKFASQLAELPGLIVKKYLGQEIILEAR